MVMRMINTEPCTVFGLKDLFYSCPHGLCGHHHKCFKDLTGPPEVENVQVVAEIRNALRILL